MQMRVTHTYALMEVSDSTFNEIEGKLREAGPDYAAMLEIEHSEEGDKTNGIAMQGIMLVRKPTEQRSTDGAEQRTIVETLESMGVPKELIGDGSGIELSDVNTRPKDALETGVMCPGFADPQSGDKLLGNRPDNVIVDELADESFALPK